jgi:hypothetical protein
VAWISGSPDLILSLALLASMWFVHSLGQKQTKLRWALALAFYVIALGAKEIAIFYPIIVVMMLWRPEREYGEVGLAWSKALSIALPFVGAAVLYVIARQSIRAVAGRRCGREELNPKHANGLCVLLTPNCFPLSAWSLVYGSRRHVFQHRHE